MFSETQRPGSGQLFFEELVQALELNLEKAGLSEQYQGLGKNLLTRSAQFTSSFLPSFAHKDLSTSNIILSDDNERVRFIDPRIAVPYLDESGASGNVVIDLAAYLVSLERKELEAKKDTDALDYSSLKEEVQKEIKRYLSEGVFTESFLKLCETVWYSIYAACKCDYCTATERLWLYNEMVRRCEKNLNELI